MEPFHAEAAASEAPLPPPGLPPPEQREEEAREQAEDLVEEEEEGVAASGEASEEVIVKDSRWCTKPTQPQTAVAIPGEERRSCHRTPKRRRTILSLLPKATASEADWRAAWFGRN